MPETFGAGYAAAYDWLYGTKDYRGECALIERIFERYATRPVTRVLDLGCGSGRHMAELARLGYQVTGVDRSSSMLAEAEQRLAGTGARLIESDLRGVELGERFDAVLMMFAVLGYQTTDADVLAALGAAHRHLRPGGLLIFDCWFGPAVLTQRPGRRSVTVETPTGPLTRVASGELDEARGLCHVDFHVNSGARPVDERHTMRFFFADELGGWLKRAGFEWMRLGAFPDFDKEPTAETWNAMAVARA